MSCPPNLKNMTTALVLLQFRISSCHARVCALVTVFSKELCVQQNGSHFDVFLIPLGGSHAFEIGWARHTLRKLLGGQKLLFSLILP